MLEIPVIRFDYSCYQCDEAFRAIWPFNADITSPVALSLIGSSVQDDDHVPVDQTENGWRNVCPACGAGQGNFHMRNRAMEEAYTAEPDWIEVEISCAKCDRLAETLATDGYDEVPLCEDCAEA